jgi:hypothetical protein
MIQALTAGTLALFEAYYADRELRLLATSKGRTRKPSRKIRRAGPPATDHQRRDDTNAVSEADFSDRESVRVLDAIADGLIWPLALQAARDDDEAEWLANQQERQ